jgi:hypothetical protein
MILLLEIRIAEKAFQTHLWLAAIRHGPLVMSVALSIDLPMQD